MKIVNVLMQSLQTFDLPFLPLAQIKVLIRENLHEAFPNEANERFALRIEGPRTLLEGRFEPVLSSNT